MESNIDWNYDLVKKIDFGLIIEELNGKTYRFNTQQELRGFAFEYSTNISLKTYIIKFTGKNKNRNRNKEYIFEIPNLIIEIYLNNEWIEKPFYLIFNDKYRRYKIRINNINNNSGGLFYFYPNDNLCANLNENIDTYLSRNQFGFYISSNKISKMNQFNQFYNAIFCVMNINKCKCRDVLYTPVCENQIIEILKSGNKISSRLSFVNKVNSYINDDFEEKKHIIKLLDNIGFHYWNAAPSFIKNRIIFYSDDGQIISEIKPKSTEYVYIHIPTGSLYFSVINEILLINKTMKQTFYLE